MLKNYSKKINFDIDIENTLKIKRGNKFILNDDIFADFLSINNYNFSSLKNRYDKLLGQLNCDIPANKSIIGKKNYNDYILSLKSTINYCQKNINSYYFTLLQNRKYLTSTITNLNNLSLPLYDHITHKTGRVKIKSGYNFLTSKKSDKENFKPSKGKYLIEIDFKSAEPSLLYSLLNGPVQEDLYKKINIPVERKKSKLAVISTIYGSSYELVKKMTGVKREHYEKIKNIFSVNDIKNFLDDEYEEKNCIQNLYGRHIYGKTNLVNYWLQSSAADFAISSFHHFNENHSIDVKAIIHDAILFECTPVDYDKIKKLNFLIDPITNISIPIDKRIIAK